MEVVFAVSIVAILSTVKLELTPHDYTLRKVVNPFPEPANDFCFKVVEFRSAEASAHNLSEELCLNPLP